MKSVREASVGSGRLTLGQVPGVNCQEPSVDFLGDVDISESRVSELGFVTIGKPPTYNKKHHGRQGTIHNSVTLSGHLTYTSNGSAAAHARSGGQVRTLNSLLDGIGAVFLMRFLLRNTPLLTLILCPGETYFTGTRGPSLSSIRRGIRRSLSGECSSGSGRSTFCSLRA